MLHQVGVKRQDHKRQVLSLIHISHAQITTDYSESLLEFITGTATDPAATLAELEDIHRFAYDKLCLLYTSRCV